MTGTFGNEPDIFSRAHFSFPSRESSGFCRNVGILIDEGVFLVVSKHLGHAFSRPVGLQIASQIVLTKGRKFP